MKTFNFIYAVKLYSTCLSKIVTESVFEKVEKGEKNP